jgi:hypothetical protein
MKNRWRFRTQLSPKLQKGVLWTFYAPLGERSFPLYNRSSCSSPSLESPRCLNKANLLGPCWRAI